MSPDALKMIGVFGTFIGLFGLVNLLLRIRLERSSVRSGLEQAWAATDWLPPPVEEKQPFAKRVGVPAARGLANVVYKIGPKGLREQTRKRLVLAGLADKLDPDMFFAFSVTLPMFVLGLLGFMTFTAGPPTPMLWLFVPGSGYFVKMWLTSKVETRQEAIGLALPDTLDLLTIAVEAGLGFDSALQRVVANMKGPLSDELYRMLQELRIGVPRHEALKNLGERTGVESLDQFITAINQADTFGIAVGKVLRVQAGQLRQKRSQLAEEKAAKTPVKLLFPLIACVFPALFTVLIGPAVINLLESFSRGGI